MSLLLEAKNKEIEALKSQLRLQVQQNAENVREQIDTEKKNERLRIAARRLAESVPASKLTEEYFAAEAAL